MDLPHLAYFGLKEEPFSTVPSPRYFFLTAMHSTALEKTAYVVAAHKGLAVVHGDTGTGKSSLARLLHQKFLDAGFLSALLVNPNYPTPNSLLRTIAQELGTPRTSRSFKGTLDTLKDHLWSTAATERRTVVLIIDEAQALRPPLLELLRQLINFETNDSKLLQLVLFAQDELRNTLARPALRNFRSRIVMASTLERLSLDELHAMLRFRWQVASGGGHHPFSRDAVATIFEQSEGTPREANILADNSLLLAFHRQSRTVSRAIVQSVADDRRENLARKEAADVR
ncbi:MAG: AAA family ATPase [Dehalococcoidia bacterium]|nr:AAA family ATPase [Dehalococcoidia bacterium]